ncbi:MAG: 50S ribosomal protein L11 methyltransferase [Firmicutes bacterium]|nr:50S ribosomal protein L11 methyltransferase [Bacillota bacterium]
MDWIQVTIYTTSAGIEPVSGRLYQLGITGIEIEDEADFKDFLENNKDCWDYVDDELLTAKHKETCIKAYISDNQFGYEMLAAINASMMDLREYDKDGEFGRLDISTGNIKEEDWAHNWRKYFHTMEIGDRLIVKPFWENIEKTDKTVFEINPGMTFGTGSHHTTRLCLEEIESTVKPGDVVLDLGCGSGILSIVSLQFGAKSAFAVDIDPNAVDIAYDNAKRNGIDRESYTVKAGNILSDDALQNEILAQKYDVVLTNIVADVIIAVLPFVKRALNSGGIFITSGIIEDRIGDVKDALSENGFEILKENHSADWVEFKCHIM